MAEGRGVSPKVEGFSGKDNTWEPEESLDCPDLTAEFLQSHKTAHEIDKSEGGKHKAGSDWEDKGEESKPEKKKKKRQKSLGTRMDDWRYRLQWGTHVPDEMNPNEADLVPAKEANVKCPQVVISFL